MVIVIKVEFGQVQDEHLKKIICLKLAVHLGDNGHVKMCLMKQSHSGVWGSKLYVFTEQIDQVMHSGLNEA